MISIGGDLYAFVNNAITDIHKGAGGSSRLEVDVNMMTSSNGHIFRVTGLLSGTKLWCFLWSAQE